MADITPIYKKGIKDFKENYRPVNILPVLSKPYERILSKQMASFFEKILSKNQCGFRKGYNTQKSLLAMLEKWKRSVDGDLAFGVLLTDLSKTSDCLYHKLIIAKLNSYGFSWSGLKPIHDYLSNRKQSKSKLSNSYSEWFAIAFGVPKRSILGPLI